MDCFVASLLAMTVDTVSRSRDALRPRFAVVLAPSKKEGAGNAGCALHPRSRVQWWIGMAHTSIQVQRRHPTFPAQWLYGLLRALPGERLFCLRRPWEACFLTCLTPAPRRQDHTTSPYDLRAYVNARSPSTATRTTFVTTADVPLAGPGCANFSADLPDAARGFFSHGGIDRKPGDLPVGQISA